MTTRIGEIRTLPLSTFAKTEKLRGQTSCYIVPLRLFIAKHNFNINDDQGLAWTLRDWHWHLRIISAMVAVGAVLLFWLPESPRWVGVVVLLFCE